MLRQVLVLPSARRKRISLSIFLTGLFSAFAATGHAAAIKVMSDSPLKSAVTGLPTFFAKRHVVKSPWRSIRHLRSNPWHAADFWAFLAQLDHSPVSSDHSRLTRRKVP
jgi:hypothetical protein